MGFRKNAARTLTGIILYTIIFSSSTKGCSLDQPTSVKGTSAIWLFNIAMENHHFQ